MNDGGAAFPRGNGSTYSFTQDGMSLRDYFATHALALMYNKSGYPPYDIAKNCYKIADAMLKVRKEECGNNSQSSSDKSLNIVCDEYSYNRGNRRFDYELDAICLRCFNKDFTLFLIE